EVGHFHLYDLFTREGHVNEDVFAYSNRSGEERALVVYHNKYASTRGWVRSSVGYLGKTGKGEERALTQKDLGTALGLDPAGDHFTIFRDHMTGLEYIRNNRDLFDRGLYVELGGFDCHVFLDFRQVRDNDRKQYAQLAASLDGRGVPNMDEALREIFLRPIHEPFKDLVNTGLFRQLLDARVTKPEGLPTPALLDNVEQKTHRLLCALKQFSGGASDEAALGRQVRQRLDAALALPILESRLAPPKGRATKRKADLRAVADFVKARLRDDPQRWDCLFGWLFIHALGKIVAETDAPQRSRSWIDEWRLGRIVAGTLRDLGLDPPAADRTVKLIGLLTTHQDWFLQAGDEVHQALESLMKDGEVQQFLGVNRYQDIVWFNGGTLDELLSWLFLMAVVQICADPLRPGTEPAEQIAHYFGTLRSLQEAVQQAEHQVEKLLAPAER
ncbi:MAG TPA: hypothetical protein VKE98_15230, partial [Gemmataceae bacterium]|nr:hypothetical protein [Gemmataceae bacterium]